MSNLSSSVQKGRVMKVVLVLVMLYAILCFVTDLKERKMYSLPANVLGMVIFFVNEYLRDGEDMSLVVILIVSFIVFRLMAKLKVWGEGDSDYLFMLTQLIAGLSIDYGVMTFLIIELGAIAVSLTVSVIIAFIETRVRKEKLDKHYKAAALPGFSVVTELLCILCWRIYE